LTQENRTIQFGIPDGPVLVTPDVDPAVLVIGHEDVKGGFGVSLWLTPLILLPLAVLQTFVLIILGFGIGFGDSWMRTVHVWRSRTES
jgi:hypothetical protein